MITTKEALLQAIRTWIKSELPLTDSQVIASDNKGPRPPMPYLVIKVTVSDIKVGGDDLKNRLDVDDEPTQGTSGLRRATIGVRGFGEETANWLESLVQTMPLPRAQAIFKTVGISLLPLGGLQDLSQVLNTSFEDQFLREFDCYYSVESVLQSLVELEEVEVDVDLVRYPVSPDPFPVDIDIDIDVGPPPPGGGPCGPCSPWIGQNLIGPHDLGGTVFTAGHRFIHNLQIREAVYWNGVRMKVDYDYSISESVAGEGYDTITFFVPPYADDNLLIDYYAQ